MSLLKVVFSGSLIMSLFNWIYGDKVTAIYSLLMAIMTQLNMVIVRQVKEEKKPSDPI